MKEKLTTGPRVDAASAPGRKRDERPKAQRGEAQFGINEAGETAKRHKTSVFGPIFNGRRHRDDDAISAAGRGQWPTAILPRAVAGTLPGRRAIRGTRSSGLRRHKPGGHGYDKSSETVGRGMPRGTSGGPVRGNAIAHLVLWACQSAGQAGNRRWERTLARALCFVSDGVWPFSTSTALNGAGGSFGRANGSGVIRFIAFVGGISATDPTESRGSNSGFTGAGDLRRTPLAKPGIGGCRGWGLGVPPAFETME